MPKKMNWGKWLQGLISSVSNGVLTGLTTAVVIPGKTTLRELVTIALVPTVISFFMYLKQDPPPIGGSNETPK